MAAVPGDDPKTDNLVAPLARFVGEWTVLGRWDAGEELRARTVYEWGVNHKILQART